MADANLLQALKKRGKRASLDNVVVFGRVRCAIERPYVVGKALDCAPGFFAILDCYALKCLGEDYFSDEGTWDINKTYFTKGSMLIYLDNKEWIGKDVKVYGNSTRYGVKIKRQFGAKGQTDGVCAFVFQRKNDKFVIAPNKLVLLGEKDPDAKGTGLEDFMVSVITSGKINYPASVDTLLPFDAVEEYKEIPLDEVTSGFEYDDSNDMIDVTKIDLHLTYHMDTAPRSEYADAFDDEVHEKSKSRKEYAKSLINLLYTSFSEELEDDFDPEEAGYSCKYDDFKNIGDIYYDIRHKFIVEIVGRYAEPIGTSNIRGREFVDSLISAMKMRVWSEDEDITGEKLLKAVSYCESCIASDPGILWGNSGEVSDSIPLLQSSCKFAIAVVGITTGIGVDKLVSSMSYCMRMYSMSRELWFYTLIRAPYLLCLLGTSLSIVDADILYLSYYKVYGQGALKEENLSIRGDILFLENIVEADTKNSLIPEYTLKTKQSYYPGRASANLKRNHFPTVVKYIDALTLMCGNIKLSERGVENFLSFIWYTKQRQDDLEQRGLIESINEYIMLASDLEKEVLIYELLQEKVKKRLVLLLKL